MTDPHLPLSVSGVVFSTQQTVMREMVGDAVYERALAKVPAPVREAVRTTAAIGWVPVSTQEAMVTAVAHETGRMVEAFQRELVGKLAERTFSGIWRMLARFASPESMMSRVGTLWSRTYNLGSAKLEVLRPGHGELVVQGLPGDAPEFMLRGVGCSLEAVLQYSRGQKSRVVWRRTPDGAVYTVTARPK